MKVITYLAFLIGVICLSIGGWEWYTTNHSEHTALAKAKQLVNVADNKNNFGVKKEKTGYKKGDIIGLLEIPSLNKELPIIEGTDLPQLKQGVGHYIGSALPGEHGQVFIAGHRDTVFKGLGNLKKGEKIIIRTEFNTYEYKMRDSKIVRSDDRSIIDLNAKKDSLVLATCYPFLFVGHAPDRYILYAEPVSDIK